MANKRLVFCTFDEDTKNKIMANTKLVAYLKEKLETSYGGLERMVMDDSQTLFNFCIVKNIAKHLKVDIDKLTKCK